MGLSSSHSNMDEKSRNGLHPARRWRRHTTYSSIDLAITLLRQLDDSEIHYRRYDSLSDDDEDDEKLILRMSKWQRERRLRRTRERITVAGQRTNPSDPFRKRTFRLRFPNLINSSFRSTATTRINCVSSQN